MKTIKILAVLLLSIISNITFGQNDSVYIVKGNLVLQAYAISDIDSIIFYKPNINNNTVTDINGNIYNTVTIGTQVWMAENLKTTSYSNGDPIPNVTGNIQWGNLNSAAWSHYNSSSQYENPYGKLYNWFAVNDNRNICPIGWHVPSDAEWTKLTDYLGGVSVAVSKMKSTGTQFWQSPNQDATNESGFSGLPGGFRAYNGAFGWIRENGSWWSSTEKSENANVAWHRSLTSNNSVGRGGNDKKTGFSVRCLKD